MAWTAFTNICKLIMVLKQDNLRTASPCTAFQIQIGFITHLVVARSVIMFQSCSLRL